METNRATRYLEKATIDSGILVSSSLKSGRVCVLNLFGETGRKRSGTAKHPVERGEKAVFSRDARRLIPFATKLDSVDTLLPTLGYFTLATFYPQPFILCAWTLHRKKGQIECQVSADS